MAQKLGLMNQWLWGKWADRDAINRNADDLENVEQDVSKLREVTKRQADEILQLRALVGSLVDLLAEKAVVDTVELEGKVKVALAELAPPPKTTKGAPYRDSATDHQNPAEVEAAKKLMAVAQDHHFAKRFAEARATYQQVVDYYATTKQADVARQQLENLKHL